MRIAFVADGRTEHTRRWVSYLGNKGVELLLLSTYPCRPLEGVQIKTLPGVFRPGVAFLKQPSKTEELRKFSPSLGKAIIDFGWDRWLTGFWWQVKTIDVIPQAIVVRKQLQQFRPDLVHALRLQNEGYVAALAGAKPLMVSLWGQDLVLFAHRYAVHRLLTPLALKHPVALTADCQRDIDLAYDFGLRESAITSYFPTNGGLDLTTFRFGPPAADRESLVVFPRGIGPYIRIDTLLHAIRILRNSPKWRHLKFILLVQNAGVERVLKMVNNIVGDTQDAVFVHEFLEPSKLAELFRRAAIMVSPATTDGTPNSMLEAMACGAFPIVSNLESTKEWIEQGNNGLLFDVENSDELALMIERAFLDTKMRHAAQTSNLRLVQEKADSQLVMPQVLSFYRTIVSKAYSNN